MAHQAMNSLTFDWHPFGLAFSSPFARDSRLAVASFETNGNNFLSVFKIVGPSVIPEAEVLMKFPPTCAKFGPNGGQGDEDLLITCGDTLKVWETSSKGASTLSDISLNETSDPITCADWSLYQDSIVLVGSTDATATAVDLNTQQIVARVVAHDHPVHDICFCGASSTFITAGFDGSLRFFDLRELQTSYIYYQTAMPLMRASVSPMETFKMATFAKDSKTVVIIDSRKPGVPVAMMTRHEGSVTCLGWSKLACDRIYTTDDKGSMKLGTISSDSLDMEADNWWKSDEPIESFSIGQGIIALSRGKQVDIVEGLKPAVSKLSKFL